MPNAKIATPLDHSAPHARTTSAPHTRTTPRPGSAEPRSRWLQQTGDSLIEVLAAALMLVLIVVATLTALNNTNHASALDRSRAQADSLAQQDEDELRSQPVKKLSELSKTHEVVLQEVTKGGTHYTITSTAKYISDKTATASCTSSTPSADYIQTTSKVTWPAMGSTKPVVETGIVAPPADSALIMQVTGAAGEPVSNMTVEATGPSNVTAETSSDGCAILAVLPGEYKLNVHRLGYVDQNGYANANEDPSNNSSVYVVAENTVKKSYEFAPAGELAVTFSGANAEGDSFVAFNTGLTGSFRTFGTIESYKTTVNSTKTIFPFTSEYTVYAGTCESNLPTNNGQLHNSTVVVAAGTITPVTVALAAIEMTVRNGTSEGTPGTVMTSGVTGSLEDTGCKTTRKFTANSKGELPKPGMPFGTYSLCVAGTISGKHRKLITPVTNNNASGVKVPIYLGSGKEEAAGC
ncbi:MAG TPA: carboxypeptidase-like regulatory domain-containing protein [Solirubrobacteraceae bacterium]|jgi:Tfp pilus assembly protein PilV